ncbi:hypothetical protein CQW23_09106 [Capsicum baccatum]|uniref:Protein kinase domain-containing protein n=1 Tax=Capsicum baccatum TaxID=33114 RepID=A0A2G2WW12_CAPBA|nr:hypothetical protein CQW23_09106 [Capsicum baccatum]
MNAREFDMKNLGVADVILGIRIHRTPQGLALSQSHYIENVLDKFKYIEFGIVKTPLDASFALRKNEDKAGEEEEWLQNFLEDILYWPKPMAPVFIHCDSQAAIDYVKSKDNMSDPLTKGLSREGLERISKRMGLRPRTSSLPPEIGNLKVETLIDLSMNQFSNGIPREIGGLRTLVHLSLRHNKFHGSIPDSVNNMCPSMPKFIKAQIRSEISIAVKVFDLQLDAVFKSFDTECEVLHILRHRNLVKVITSCSNLDFKDLVLEYMPNGSLHKYLYSHNYFLDIRQRLSTMIDVACALKYLHHGCSSLVIHCDLNPSNVLLDEDMVAHLSDFGISKLLGEDQEYGLEGLVSTKCDVYSYGVMLLETFTTRRPNEFEGDLILKQWVSYSLPDVVMDVIDANLVTQMGSRLQMVLNVVASIIKVELDCCAESPARRTNMKDVVGILQKINIQLLSC